MRRLGAVVLFLLLLASIGHAGVLATDTFTRANETPLAGNWTHMFTSPRLFNLSSNAVVPGDFATGDIAAFYNAITWPDDQYAQLTLVATSGGVGGNGLGPAVRMGAAGVETYYRFIILQTGEWRLNKFVTGGFTALASGTATAGANAVVRLEVRTIAGNAELKMFVNGGQVGSTVTDSTSPILTGRAGFAYSTQITSGTIDNFEGGDFGTASTSSKRMVVY